MTFNAQKASLAIEPQPAVILNATGMVLLWNKAAEDLFGWTSPEVEGRPAVFLTPEGEKVVNTFQDNQDNGGKCLVNFLCRDGRELLLPMVLITVKGHYPGESHRLIIVLKKGDGDLEIVDSISRQRLIDSIPDSIHPDLQARVQFESLLSTISTDLIKASCRNLPPVLQNTLNAVREYFGADHAVLGYTTRREQDETQVITSQADYMKNPPESATETALTALFQHLNRTPYFRFSNLNELPLDWTRERNLAAKYGVTSGLWILLRTRDRDVGFIALNMRDSDRQWSMETAQRLRLFGKIMVENLFRGQVEHELAEAKIFQETILENLPIGVFAKNASDLTFAFMNGPARKLVGLGSNTEIAGRSNEDLFSPEDAQAFTSQDRMVLQTRKLLEIDRQAFTTASGNTRAIRTRKVPVFDKNDQARYLVGIIEDLTGQIASSDENIFLRNKLQEVSQSESMVQAAGSFTHDFNNFIFGIMGYIGLIKEMTDNQEILNCLEQILEGANRAADLIDHIQNIHQDLALKASN